MSHLTSLRVAALLVAALTNQDQVLAPPLEGTGPARVGGRFVDADGAPAPDVSITLAGTGPSSEGALQPKWSAPRPFLTGPDGRFELALPPHVGWTFVARAETPDAAVLEWRWTDLAPGDERELGDVPLVPLGTLSGRIVDGEGDVITDGWMVLVECRVDHVSGAEIQSKARVAPDPATGEFRATGVAVGDAVVRAMHLLGERTPLILARIERDGTSFAELTYDGPDLARRLVVNLRLASAYGRFDPPLETVRLFGPDGTTLTAAPARRGMSRYVFDDLDPGSWTLDVLDERIQPVERPGLLPGRSIDVAVTGNATVILEVVDDRTGEPVPAYGLSMKRPKVDSFSPATQVRADGTPAPVEDRVEGLVAGSVELEVRATGRSPVRTTVELAPDEVREVEVRVARAVALEGYVLRPDGKTPAAGVEVEITHGDVAGHSTGGLVVLNNAPVPARDARTKTDADGWFRFEGLAPGQNTLRACFSQWLCVDRTLRVDGEASQGAVELVEPASGYLEGRLLLPAGASAEEVRILLFAGEGRVHSANQLPPGREEFRFGQLPIGDVQLITILRGGSNIPETVSIEAGVTVEHDIDLRGSFPAVLSVRVRIDGEARTPIQVELNPVRVDARRKIQQAIGEVRADGSLVVGAYSPGSWGVRVSEPDGSFVWDSPEPVELLPGEQRHIEIELVSATRLARFVDAAGAALVETEVAVTQATQGVRTRRVLRTDRDGLLDLRLWVGDATFEFKPSKGVTIPWPKDGPASIEIVGE